MYIHRAILPDMTNTTGAAAAAVGSLCSKCQKAPATLTLADNGVLNVNRCTPCAKVDLWGNPGDFVGRLSHMVQYVWPANGASRFDLDDDARRMVEARAGR